MLDTIVSAIMSDLSSEDLPLTIPMSSIEAMLTLTRLDGHTCIIIHGLSNAEFCDYIYPNKTSNAIGPYLVYRDVLLYENVELNDLIKHTLYSVYKNVNERYLDKFNQTYLDSVFIALSSNEHRLITTLLAEFESDRENDLRLKDMLFDTGVGIDLAYTYTNDYLFSFIYTASTNTFIREPVKKSLYLTEGSEPVFFIPKILVRSKLPLSNLAEPIDGFLVHRIENGDLLLLPTSRKVRLPLRNTPHVESTFFRDTDKFAPNMDPQLYWYDTPVLRKCSFQFKGVERNGNRQDLTHVSVPLSSLCVVGKAINDEDWFKPITDVESACFVCLPLGSTQLQFRYIVARALFDET